MNDAVSRLQDNVSKGTRREGSPPHQETSEALLLRVWVWLPGGDLPVVAPHACNVQRVDRHQHTAPVALQLFELFGIHGGLGSHVEVPVTYTKRSAKSNESGFKMLLFETHEISTKSGIEKSQRKLLHRDVVTCQKPTSRRYHQLWADEALLSLTYVVVACNNNVYY